MKQKWIKKGDKVFIICGNDRGQMGTVLAKKGDRILVQGVNIRKRHMKGRDQNHRSEIINIERPIHISNVSLCNASGKKIKLRSKCDQNGGKELVYDHDQKEESYRMLKNASKHPVK